MLNINKFIEWFKNFVLYLQQNNGIVLINSPVNKGLNVLGDQTHNNGGVEYYKNYFNKDGIGDHILNIAFKVDNNIEKTSEFISIYNVLKTEQHEVFTYKQMQVIIIL